MLDDSPSHLHGEVGTATNGMNPSELAFSPVVGEICWGASYEPQLNLSLSFGEPHLRIREPRPDDESPVLRRRRVRPSGKWWLWVYASRWKLAVSGEKPVTAAASKRRVDRALRTLEGEKLTRVTVDPKTAATRLEFDLGSVLSIHRYSSAEQDDLWILYGPADHTVALLADGSVRAEIGSTPVDARDPAPAPQTDQRSSRS